MEPDRIDTVFDAAAAVSYGAFIAVAYDMHRVDPGNPAPALQPAPNGFKFIAWVQMKDFVLSSSDWSFYGLLAQSTADPDRFVLAIRGTSSPEEWWDDLTSVVPAPWNGPGLVGFGFDRIYQTLRIVDLSVPAPAPAVAAMAASAVGQGGTFAEQVAAAVHRHAEAARPAIGAVAAAKPAVRTIAVTGHSLGGALATLYVAEHAHKAAAGTAMDGVEVSLLCTFASPRTGDPVFARAFDALPLTSWHIVNELDVVPKLPAIGFEHVDQLQLYNSGLMVRWTPTCWHSLLTYLHLLDPRQPLDAGCAFMASGAAVTAAMGAMALPVSPPPQPVSKDLTLTVPRGQAATISITINVG